MPLVVVERDQGPEGTVVIEDVWLEADWCSGDPVLVVVGAGFPSTIACPIRGEAPLFGPHPCADGSGPWNNPEAESFTIDVLEPFEDPDSSIANDGVHLHARLRIEGGGWDLELEVDVPDCGDGNCYCPCE